MFYSQEVEEFLLKITLHNAIIDASIANIFIFICFI